MTIPSPVRDWLVAPESDPSVRAFVRSELLDRPPGDAELVADRAAIGREGWVAKFLALQLPEGQWDTPRNAEFSDLYLPKYLATNWRLIILGELGADRALPGVARGVELWLARTAPPEDSMGGAGSEVCFTGNAVRTAHALGFGDDPRVATAIDWLIASQKSDGGWHCFPSEVGTLDGWEAMAAFAALPAARRSAAMRRAIERGAAFYLDRHLLTEGPTAYAPWTRLHYPVHYYYDYLVGLEFLTGLGYGDDPRLGPVLDRLESARDGEGRWRLDALHPDIGPAADYALRTPYYPVALEPMGEPSRWITARALRVLRRAGRL